MAFNLPIFRARTNLSNYRNNNANQLLENIFNDFRGFPHGNELSFSPHLDISETESAYHIETELPGLEQDDIDIKVDNNILTIKGKKEEQAERKERNYYNKERYFGEFTRSVSLPASINSEDIEASFKNGVLEINIPKKSEGNAKKISIK